MKIIISLFLWIVGIINFFIIAVIIWILFLLSFPKKIHPVIRLLFKFQLKIIGVNYTITGLDNFDHKSSFIIMGNHESLFDIFAVPAAIPMYFVAVEADYHFSMPIWGKLTKRWGNIPINRNNINEAKKVLFWQGMLFRKAHQ